MLPQNGRMSSKLYTTKQAAAAVGITRATVQAWIAAKKIRAPKVTVVGSVAVRMWSRSDIEKLEQTKVKFYRKGRGRKSKSKR
jgi:excisionase family DNA binding protein